MLVPKHFTHVSMFSKQVSRRRDVWRSDQKVKRQRSILLGLFIMSNMLWERNSVSPCSCSFHLLCRYRIYQNGFVCVQLVRFFQLSLGAIILPRKKKKTNVGGCNKYTHTRIHRHIGCGSTTSAEMNLVKMNMKSKRK